MTTPSSATRPSICRVCHNLCPIEVDIDADGHAVAVRGDRHNPLYQGYSCVKGRALPELMGGPERLLRSLVRADDGELRPIAAADATAQIAATLAELIERHGPRSVAAYIGNTGVLNLPAHAVLTALMGAIGAPLVITPSTIDQSGKFVAKGIHGMWLAPHQGLERPDAAVLIGTNPLVCHQPLGHPGRWWSEQLERGMRLVVVDPRRTEIARRATLHLQPRPGFDVQLLATIIRLLIERDLVDRSFIDEDVDGFDRLARTVSSFDPAAVSAAADVPLRSLEHAAELYGTAQRAFTMAGTGPNMAGNGTLLEYLVLAVDTICGRYLRAGDPVVIPGTLAPPFPAVAQAQPPFPSYGTGTRLDATGLVESLGGVPIAGLPAEMATDHPNRIRALICIGGNPAISWPDQAGTVAALRQLELFVVIDPRLTASARLAHYVLPPRMCLELPGHSLTSDLQLQLGAGYGLPRPHAQWTPAVAETPAGSELIEEWRVLLDVATHLGKRLVLTSGGGGHAQVAIPPLHLDPDQPPSTEELLAFLAAGSRVPLDEVKRSPHGRIFDDHDMVVSPKTPGWEGRLQVGDPAMMEVLQRLAPPVVAPAGDDLPMRLISRRMMAAYNSFAREPSTLRGRPYNPCFLHPSDMERLGIADGDAVRVRSRTGEVLAIAAADPSLRPSVVSMVHCFGDLPGEDDDPTVQGSNTNRLLANEVLDPFTGQTRMSNEPVAVSLHEPRPAG